MVASMANIRGTSQADTIKGTMLIDQIAGNGGNDVIDGGEGDDFLDGNSGDDQLFGQDGNDVLLGNSGNDFLSDGAGDDVVNGGSGDDYVLAGAGNDTFIGGSGFDTIDFSTSDAGIRLDLSKGTATGQGIDTVQSFEAVVGSNFSDFLRGNAADERINGGAGNDRIRGEAGNDVLTGGEGRDTFIFKTTDVFGDLGDQNFVDTITDFSTTDRLDVRDLLSNLSYEYLEDVLRIEDDGQGNSTLQVNRGQGFENVAVLENFALDGVPIIALAVDGVILT
jgi:Ca2+-binding RTX toxin-like protein